MHEIKLTDQIYDQVKRRADEAGFTSVADYIVNVLTYDGATEYLDHLFTPERIAQLDRISAEAKAGGMTYTLEEVSTHLAKKRADWIQRHDQ